MIRQQEFASFRQSGFNARLARENKFRAKPPPTVLWTQHLSILLEENVKKLELCVTGLWLLLLMLFNLVV